MKEMELKKCDRCGKVESSKDEIFVDMVVRVNGMLEDDGVRCESCYRKDPANFFGSAEEFRYNQQENQR